MGNESVFSELNNVDVSKYIEIKNTGKVALKYLSWSYAWQEVKKRYPDARASLRFIDGKPYTYDDKTGYMVYTEVTINGETQEMWLPVMDSHNASMLDHPYEVKTKYNSYTVPACTMNDINKALMRCMAKNLAMFGLGLYIYNGEDLPEDAQTERTENKPAPKSAPQKTTEPDEDYIRLEQVYNAHKDIVIGRAKELCETALNTGKDCKEMLSRLTAYLDNKGVAV